MWPKAKYSTSLSRHNVTQMFCSRKAPKRAFLFYPGDQHSHRDGPVAENSSVSLLPYFPGDKHHQGDKRPSRWSFLSGILTPPILNQNHINPIVGLDIVERKPSFDHAPNPNGVSTLKEKVGRRFMDLLA